MARIISPNIKLLCQNENNSEEKMKPSGKSLIFLGC